MGNISKHPSITERLQPGAAPSDLLSDYTRKEDLARDFDVSPRTIERWVRLRLLSAPVKLGRTSLFHIPTVREDIKKRRLR